MATNELSLEHFLKPIGENPKELPLDAFITGSADSAEAFHEPSKVEAKLSIFTSSLIPSNSIE